MFRDTFTPTSENPSYEFPKEMYGKEVVIEDKKEESNIGKEVKTLADVLPEELLKNDWLKDVPYIPDFPSIEEIRKTAWRDPWKK
ncbi:MAG: hypothetical protein ACKVOU_11950 [Cytophagales bacterium]